VDLTVLPFRESHPPILGSECGGCISMGMDADVGGSRRLVGVDVTGEHNTYTHPDPQDISPHLHAHPYSYPQDSDAQINCDIKYGNILRATICPCNYLPV
jgi:hypothetical protein